MNKKLPSKLSELLRLAVADAQEIEKTPGYELNMNEWHTFYDGVCHVCMAGAVIGNTLGVSDTKTIFSLFGTFGEETANRLSAIDDMRTGTLSWRDAVDEFGATISQLEAIESCNDFIGDNVSGFMDRAEWPVYLHAADILEKAGL